MYIIRITSNNTVTIKQENLHLHAKSLSTNSEIDFTIGTVIKNIFFEKSKSP